MNITERQILELFIEKELELKELKAEVKTLNESTDYWCKKYFELEIELEGAKDGYSEEVTEN